MEFEEKYSRLLGVYSKEQMQKLMNSHVCVVGLGGVGSYCTTALARSGVGKLTIVDFDKVEESNINRQEFANAKTLGRYKVDVARQFIANINDSTQVDVNYAKVNADNVALKIPQCDFIIDAIDDIPAKLAIVKYAQELFIPIISCMGTAQRIDSSKLKIVDLFKTDTCPMCRRFRKLAKDRGIIALDVLYSDEPPVKINNYILGSTSYIPPIAGLMLAGHVINYLIN